MRVLIFDRTELRGQPQRSRDVTGDSLPCTPSQITDADLIAVAEREHGTYWILKTRFAGRLGTIPAESFFEALEAAVKEHVNGQR